MRRYALGMIGVFALAAAGSANAVSLNPKGLGQTLLFPYYTVNRQQDTLLSVVNTSDVGKMARLRFMEGYNGRSVAELNLFLAPHDVWVGGITAADQGDVASGALLVTNDKSCVAPMSTGSNGVVQPLFPLRFATVDFDGGNGVTGPDAGPQTIGRTREGHFELIALADIAPDSDTARRIAHVDNGQPNGANPVDCSGLSSPVNFILDLVAPTSGLAGSASIINVSEGTFFAYNADAIVGFTDRPLVNSTADAQLATLKSANSHESRLAARAYLSTNAGKSLNVDYANGIDAVSAVLMADNLYNEYFVSAEASATDWVVTFPTKRFYVDKQRYIGAPIAPFEQAFAADVGSPVAVGQRTFDRESIQRSNGCPGVPPEHGICFTPPLGNEVNVISFQPLLPDDQVSLVFGSRLVGFMAPLGSTGWVELAFGGSGHQLARGNDDLGASVLLNGLPVSGFMAYNVINANAAPGRLANYSAAFPHRSSVSCSGTSAGCL